MLSGWSWRPHRGAELIAGQSTSLLRVQPDPLEVASWELELGELDPERLPALAVDALVRGLDSPALLALAAQDAADTRASLDLFRTAVEELGIVVPERDELVWNLVRETARLTAAGVLSPAVGCRALARRASSVEHGDDLMVFVALADELQGWVLDDRTEVERAIRAEVDALLEQPRPCD